MKKKPAKKKKSATQKKAAPKKKPAKKAKPAAKKKPAKKAKPARKKKAAPKAKPARAKSTRIDATVTMWEPIMPVDRGERYEDPLQHLLGDRGDVVGGGSGLTEEGEIEFVDIELELDDDPALIEAVVRALEVRGAPKHSRIAIQRGDDTTVIEFGVAEGIAIYFDGVNLPEDVYRTCNLDDLCDKIEPIIEDSGEIRGSWPGPTHTALYLYSIDAEAQWRLIEPVIRAYPLSQGAVVVLRIGHEDGKPRELQL